MPLLTHHDIGTGFPLVLGGSYLWGRDMWAPQIHLLSRRYRLIIPELPGHDNDLPLSAAFTTPACLAHEVGHLLDVLGIGQYAVAGLSAGGMWAAELALPGGCPRRYSSSSDTMILTMPGTGTPSRLAAV